MGRFGYLGGTTGVVRDPHEWVWCHHCGKTLRYEYAREFRWRDSEGKGHVDTVCGECYDKGQAHG